MIHTLILHSWENNDLAAKEWAMALCNELSEYKNTSAICDMFWEPSSDVKTTIKSQIERADKIVVIVTQDYNKKIIQGEGMVSYEEALYKGLIKKTEDKNKILFVLKQREVSLPPNWEAYNRVDLSACNLEEYASKSDEIDKSIGQIVRILHGRPEYKRRTASNRKRIPASAKSKNFYELFMYKATGTDEPQEQGSTIKEQERRLLRFIADSANQRSFVYEYIKSGLSSDTNLNGRMTPALFIKHFLVERKDREEDTYKRTIGELFSSYNYNMLCIQSDGGSGKSIFLNTIAYRYAEQKKQADIATVILYLIFPIFTIRMYRKKILFFKSSKNYIAGL